MTSQISAVDWHMTKSGKILRLRMENNQDVMALSCLLNETLQDF